MRITTCLMITAISTLSLVAEARTPAFRTLYRPTHATRFKAFTYTTSRTYHTSDSPSRASQVVSSMRVSDGATAIPPGVSASRVGPGSFRAQGPGVSVRADVRVTPSSRGGSTVTETVRSSSICPAAAVGAAVYHNTMGTSLSQAYGRAAARTR